MTAFPFELRSVLVFGQFGGANLSFAIVRRGAGGHTVQGIGCTSANEGKELHWSSDK